MNQMPPITKNLLIINVIFFLASLVAPKYGVDLTEVLGLHYFMASDFHLYQLVTYMFMHGGFAHLFFNMFALWMFGTTLERVFGPRRFLIYYMVCGLGAGLMQELVQYIEYATVLSNYDSVNTGTAIIPMSIYLNLMTTVGASGAVYGILLGFGVNLAQIAAVGAESLPIILTTIATALIVGYILYRVLSVDSAIATLIAVGSSICGGSAIAATAPVLRAKDEQVAQAISVIFLFNVIAALIAMGISMIGVSLVAMNTFAFGIRCAGPFAAYGLGLAVPKATKNSGMISIFTGTIAFVVWQLLSNGGTLWFMMPVVFGSLVSVITFYVVNLIEWKRGGPAAPSAYTVEEAK